MKQEAMNEEELDKKFRKTLMMLYSSDFERTKEEGRREIAQSLGLSVV